LLIYGIFFSTAGSVKIWENVKWLQYLEFPFRFSFVIAFAIAALSGFAVNSFTLNGTVQKSIIIAFVYLMTLCNLSNHLQTQDIIDYRFQQRAFTMDYFGIDKLKYFDKYSSEDYLFLPANFQYEKFNKPVDARAVCQNNYNIITDYSEIAGQVLFTAILNDDDTIILKLPFFPNWSVYDNNKKTKLFIDGNGLINFRLDKGAHRILATFELTIIRKFAIVLSLIGLLLFIINIIKIQ